MVCMTMQPLPASENFESKFSSAGGEGGGMISCGLHSPPGARARARAGPAGAVQLEPAAEDPRHADVLDSKELTN